MVYVEVIKGYPYMTKKGIADEFHLSKTTVYLRAKEIKEEIHKGRYGEHAIVEDGNIVLINALVFLDYMTFRDMLTNKNTRKYVPPFEPAKVREICGWENRIVHGNFSEAAEKLKEVTT